VKDKRETAASVESKCQRLGDLAGLAAPADAPAPGAEHWAEIEHRLDRSWHGPSARRLLPVLAVCAAVVLCAAGWLVARRPLGYRLEGCMLVADGSLATSALRGGVITFEDGSRMSVDRNARFRLGMLAFGHGAEISIYDGEARLAVVHRSGAHWAIVAGPFRVDVTGTRFGVRWSRQRGQFRVTMLEGEVLVTGGAVPPGTRLHAGQTLSADLVASSFAIANEHLSLDEARREGSTGGGQGSRAVPLKQESAGPRGERTPLPAASPLPATSPRRRNEALARGENPSSGEPVLHPELPASSEPANVERPVAPLAPRLAPPAPFASDPLWPSQIAETKPASLRVVLGETGQLANGFSGATWVAGGEGTTFSTPASWDDRAHLRPEAGLLCANGTVAGLVCVNEGTPRMMCNWERNWGVAVGWHARADQKAWSDEAQRGLAVEFRGRSGDYRLDAHLKGDPSERIYCVENYKSGQVVRPSMFKSECWFGRGDILKDFTSVDSFSLQFSSGMSYVAFHYCVSGITIYP
jgi:hypothetical protein